MKNVVGQAIDEFTSAIANTTATSNMTQMSSAGAYRSIGSSSNLKGTPKRSDSIKGMIQGDSPSIVEVLQKAEMTIKSRPN